MDWSMKNKHQLNKLPYIAIANILHAIVMRISSIKTLMWLAVNLHQLFSNGDAFNTQSRSSLTSYAIRAQNRMQYIVQPYLQ